MNRDVYRFLGFILVTVITLIGVAAFFHLVLLLPIEGKEPEWIGAIGTVGTLLGTLWIATAQDRKELTQARLYAAGFTLKVVNARGAIGKVCRSLSIDAETDRGEAKITLCIFDLEKIDLWTVADLVPMTPLSPRVIGQLAEASDQIATAIKALEMVREGDQSLATSVTRKAFARHLHHLLSGTAKLLDEGVQVCDHARRALHMHSE